MVGFLVSGHSLVVIPKGVSFAGVRLTRPSMFSLETASGGLVLKLSQEAYPYPSLPVKG